MQNPSNSSSSLLSFFIPLYLCDCNISKYDIIFWNGTLGVVENDLYKYGSNTLIQLLMKSNKKVIIGGGDTACFVNNFNHGFYYVSTGGGASIDYISNGNLVGLNYIID